MAKKMMFIDDDEAFVVLVQRATKKIDNIASIVTARDGREALDLLSQMLNGSDLLPDLILVDVNMPRMDGFAFLQEFFALRESQPILKKVRPVVMLSSSDDIADKERSKALGADGYITKPNTLNHMRQILSELAQ